MPGKIFVNYRRDDSAPHALNIAQYLEREFGARNVFLDIDRMRAGQDFPSVLKERLDACKVLIAVIGPSWLTLTNDDGTRRLDDPDDWVRLEISNALARNVAVIPVLVGGAALPKKSDLPDVLQPLLQRHVANITTNGFRNEMAGLVRDIRAIPDGRNRWRAIAAAAAVLIAGWAGAYQLGLPVWWPHLPLSDVSVSVKTTPAKPDGETTSELTVTAKRGGASAKPQPSVDESVEATIRQQQKGDDDAYAFAQSKDTIDAYNTYHLLYPTGRHMAQSVPRLQALMRAKEAEVAAAQRKAEEIRQRQERDAAEAARRDPVAALVPGSGKFAKDCDMCPEMVVVPSGSFTMGSTDYGREKPPRGVSIAKPFAVGRYAVTFDEWDACVTDGGCATKQTDQGWGRGKRPVIKVSWDDAKAYVAWLSKKTGKTYRLLSEAEREYAARAGTTTPFWWGSSISTDQANYDGNYTYRSSGQKGEYRQKTMPVDSFEPNPWGLYQVHGNVYDWVEDCWHDNYNGAPTDGSAWTTVCTNASWRVVRGGSWGDDSEYLRSAHRLGYSAGARYGDLGFRVGRMLTP